MRLIIAFFLTEITALTAGLLMPLPHPLMRGYFRVSPRFGVSMPILLAVLLYFFWLIAAMCYWGSVLTLALLTGACSLGARAWRSRRSR